MTVVFHNSKNAVWNAIQTAILEAGFVDRRRADPRQEAGHTQAGQQPERREDRTW